MTPPTTALAGAIADSRLDCQTKLAVVMHPIASSVRRRGTLSRAVVVALLAIALPAAIAAQWQQYPTGGNTRYVHCSFCLCFLLGFVCMS